MEDRPAIAGGDAVVVAGGDVVADETELLRLGRRRRRRHGRKSVWSHEESDGTWQRMVNEATAAQRRGLFSSKSMNINMEQSFMT